MNERPLSVTIISWYLIVTCLISTLTTLFTLSNAAVHEIMRQSPIPIPPQFAMAFIGLGLNIVAGIMMLKGRHWARLLYVGWSAFAILVALATSPMKLMLIPGVLIYALIVYFLYRPQANIFFGGTPVAAANESV